ncbi:MAG: ABC transporter permease [Burkholderiales bacterium]|nr:ABC transporter permease [Burkholderiales bacterium]
MGRLLARYTWPDMRHHALRHATAVLAVLLGVALAFSVHLINASALSEFSAAVRSVNGQADLSLKAAHGTLDEALYPRVATHALVAQVSPVIDLVAQAPDAQGRPQRLRLIGLDPLVAGPLAPALIPRLTPPPGPRQAVDGRELFSPDTVSLNALARQRLGVDVGAPLVVQVGAHRARLRVIGGVTAGGEAIGVMDIAGAQGHFGLLGRLSRLDVKLVDGAQPAAAALALGLPAGVVSESPDGATQRVSNMSRAYRVNLTVLALVALFTGAFLVFSILSLSVAKRLPQLALLGVLGLSARERLALVLCESAAIGVLGSALGLALGTGLAALALRLLSGDLGGGYFPGIAPTLQWSAGAAALYGALGVAAAVAGGWLPARAAQGIAPAQALKGLGDAQAAGGSRWLGPALLALGAVLALLPPVGGVPLWAYLSVAAILLGGIACVPAAVQLALGRWPAPQRATWLLAIERTRRMRHTATIATAGVVASLSLSVALTVMVASFRESVTTWLDVVLPADLYARLSPPGGTGEGGEGGGGSAPRIPRALLGDIARLNGVIRVDGVRVSSLSLGAQHAPIALISRRLDDPARSLPLVGELAPAQAGRVAIYVSEALVDLHGARVGGTLQLPLRAGEPPVAALVRGVWRDYARQQGAIVMDEADHRRLSGEPLDEVNDVALWLRADAQVPALQNDIRAAARARGIDGARIEFAAPGEIRQLTLRIFDRSFAVTYWLQAVAIGIGLFGTAASFSAQVLARRKEFGLLSHLGFTRRQVLGIVAGEGAAFTGVGALMGLLLGLAVSVVLVHVVNPQSFHWTMDLLLPWAHLGALCLSVVAAGTLTAWLAARSAAGRDVLLAVKEDW